MSNGTISAGELGSRPITVTSIKYGLKILSLEAEARSRRAFHPKKHVPAPFSVDIVSTTYDAFKDLNYWMLSVVREMVAAENSVPFLVEVDAVDFHQYGVLTSPIPMGRPNPFVVAWRQTITFSTTKDPLDSSIPDEISFAVPATWHDEGGAPGDYPSLYAVAVGGDDIIDRWNAPDEALFSNVLHQSLSVWFS